jgi:uncharacterized protein
VTLIPIRTCVGCRTRTEKTELIRVVLDSQTPVIDPNNSKPGRGAYLHPNLECLEQALSRGGLAKAFRMKIDIQEARNSLHPSISMQSTRSVTGMKTR